MKLYRPYDSQQRIDLGNHPVSRVFLLSPEDQALEIFHDSDYEPPMGTARWPLHSVRRLLSEEGETAQEVL